MRKPVDLLLVDDNPETLDEVGGRLRAAGYQVRTAKDAPSGWEKFQAERPALVVADIRMPGESGIDLLRRIRGVSDVPVILLTARADVAAAVDALREGATDFVRFPDEAAGLLERAKKLAPVSDSGEAADAALALLPGDGEVMEKLRSRVRSLAALKVPVFVSGEVGTGRMRAARALHELSGASLPLIRVDSPDGEAPAAPCTIVLAGLEQWPRDVQNRWSALLRREGETRFARVILIGGAALIAAVERGEVRRDLWLSLSRFRIDVPPLRARSGELPAIASDALSEIASRHGRSGFSFTSGAIDSLRRRPWRGNWPELQQVIEHAVAFSKGPKLGRDAVDRAFEEVIAGREESLANRRAAKQNEDRAQLVRLLEACSGNIAEVARRLGITRGAVTYRLRKHGLSR